MITSRPYAIAGVAGFHRGAKPPAIGLSQLERRLKPVPHKNVGGSRIDHDLKIPRDGNPSGRLLDGTATKSRARRTKAVTQPSSNVKRSLLLNQHQKCLISFCCTKFGLNCKHSQVDSTVYAEIVFGGTPSKHYKLVTQSSEHMLYNIASRV